MKKAVLGCTGILLCLGLLAGCDTDLVGPGLAYHDPNTGTEVEPGPAIPEGDDPDSGDTGDEPNTGDKDTGPDPVENPEDGGDGGDGDTSETYTLAVTTSTIIENFTTNDDGSFTIGEGGTPATSCQLEGYTFNFDDVFSITFTKEEAGGESGARLWGDGIRVYGEDDFTIAPIGEWKLSSITLTFAVNASGSTSYTPLENVVSANNTELSRGTPSPVTVSNLEDYSSVVVTPDNGSVGNIAYSSIEVTCTK